MGVANFLRVRESNPQLNLLLSLEARPNLFDGVIVDFLAVCGKEKSQEDEMLQSKGPQSSKCRAEFQSAGSYLAESWMRNIIHGNGSNSLVSTETPVHAPMQIVEGDTGGSVAEFNENGGELVLCTNVSGIIINLADAATPSLSNCSDEIENFTDDATNEDEADEPSSEDMRMLLEVEELERLELAKQKKKGKSKVFDSDDEGHDTSYTNGFSEGTPDEDEDWEYEGWSHLMAHDIPPGSSTPAAVVQPEVAKIENTATATRDISEAVLGYHRDHVKRTDVEGNSSEENDSVLGFSDGEPVFDDCYNLMVLFQRLVKRMLST